MHRSTVVQLLQYYWIAIQLDRNTSACDSIAAHIRIYSSILPALLEETFISKSEFTNKEAR